MCHISCTVVVDSTLLEWDRSSLSRKLQPRMSSMAHLRLLGKSQNQAFQKKLELGMAFQSAKQRSWSESQKSWGEPRGKRSNTIDCSHWCSYWPTKNGYRNPQCIYCTRCNERPYLIELVHKMDIFYLALLFWVMWPNCSAQSWIFWGSQAETFGRLQNWLVSINKSC